MRFVVCTRWKRETTLGSFCMNNAHSRLEGRPSLSKKKRQREREREKERHLCNKYACSVHCSGSLGKITLGTAVNIAQHQKNVRGNRGFSLPPPFSIVTVLTTWRKALSKCTLFVCPMTRPCVEPVCDKRHCTHWKEDWHWGQARKQSRLKIASTGQARTEKLTTLSDLAKAGLLHIVHYTECGHNASTISILLCPAFLSKEHLCMNKP